MNWMVEIARLRRELVEMIRQMPGGLFGWTLAAKSSEMGDSDQVETADDPGSSSNDVGQQRPARRLEQWGLRGRPAAKVRTFWIRLGSSNVLYIGIAPNKGYGPTDLAGGETMLYSEAVERGVHLTKDGDNKIGKKDGRTIQLGGDDERLLMGETLLADLKDLVQALRGGDGGTTPIVDTTTGAPLPSLAVPAATMYTKIVSEQYLSENVENG